MKYIVVQYDIDAWDRDRNKSQVKISVEIEGALTSNILVKILECWSLCDSVAAYIM